MGNLGQQEHGGNYVTFIVGPCISCCFTSPLSQHLRVRLLSTKVTFFIKMRLMSRNGMILKIVTRLRQVCYETFVVI